MKSTFYSFHNDCLSEYWRWRVSIPSFHSNGASCAESVIFRRNPRSGSSRWEYDSPFSYLRLSAIRTCSQKSWSAELLCRRLFQEVVLLILRVLAWTFLIALGLSEKVGMFMFLIQWVLLTTLLSKGRYFVGLSDEPGERRTLPSVFVFSITGNVSYC